MYRTLTIDGISQTELGFKINVEDFDEFISSETESVVLGNGIFKDKSHKRKTISKDYQINIPDATVEKIDTLKRWLLKENVHFSDYSPDRYCIAYKILIRSTKRVVSNLYTMSVTVEMSSLYYSKTQKMISSVGNKITVDNTGTGKVYPTFEFRAPTDIKMIAFVHPQKGAFQIGDSISPVQITAGTSVFINLENNTVILGGNKKIYVHTLSKNWYLDTGKTEIGVIVNSGATIPSITAKIRETYL
ncbi:phage tail family protein [Carnobacteriaceae bacterium zg-ZUI252]|nr:phage tail family protein [Carnobacteriaceae bacterium zg-ZUI252]